MIFSEGSNYVDIIDELVENDRNKSREKERVMEWKELRKRQLERERERKGKRGKSGAREIG